MYKISSLLNHYLNIMITRLYHFSHYSHELELGDSCLAGISRSTTKFKLVQYPRLST